MRTKPGPKPKDFSGSKIGRVSVLEFSHQDGNKRYFRCLCYCGQQFVTRIDSLASGHTRSCGCALSERKPRLTHGLRKSAEYNSWALMIQRCTNPNSHSFSDYGGRGITVCERWRNSFADFYIDMGPKPSAEHTIDRYPDNDGSYEPSNCRWATKVEQANNRREYRNGKAVLSDEIVMDFRKRVAAGESMKALAAEAGIAYSTIRYAITGESYGHILEPPPLPTKRGKYKLRQISI